MKAEPTGSSTYKITLTREEAAGVPTDGSPQEMHRFISGIIEQLSLTGGIDIPDGRLLVEAFVKSDGSCVFFISTLGYEDSSHREKELYACETRGVDTLGKLCTALADTDTRCTIYCGRQPDRYRLIFAEPNDAVQRICCEYGDWCEISPLFAARSEEYLTEIASGSGIMLLSELLR